MSEPTPLTKQKAGNKTFWTTTWADPRRPGTKRGRAHMKRFGRCDKVSFREAKNIYRRWLDKEYPALLNAGTVNYSVDQLCRDYYAEMGKRYIVDGKHTTSVNRIRISLDSFRAAYGTEEADAMTASKVAAWLETFIHGRLRVRKGTEKKPRVKGTVNLALTYVKRMYRWGAKYGRVADAAAGAVQLAENVRGDHPDVRKKDPVRAVAWETVKATKAKCAPVAAAVLDVLWLTGMRPGECLMMRPCDLTLTDGMRIYTPRRHKNTHHGKERKIVLGPKAWAVIEPLLPSRTDAPIFPTPWLGTRSGNFATYIRRRASDAGVEPFTPNQIRHSYATLVEDMFGAEMTQAVLGHATLNQQKTYVEKSLRKAIEVARQVG